MKMVDSWILFDNSETKPRIIAKKQKDDMCVRDKILFNKIITKLGVKI